MIAADISPGESIEDIVQSDERTFAYLMARARQPQPSSEAPANEMVAGSAPTSKQDEWPTDAPEISRAVQVEAEESPAEGQFQLLQQIQTAEPADSESSPPPAEESPYVQPINSQESTGYSEFAAEFDTAVASANQSSAAPLPGDADTTVQQAALSQAATDEAAIVPTAYATTAPAKPGSDVIDHSALEESLRVPTVYFRDVEPLATSPSAPSPKPAKAPPFHLAERLAKMLKLPVSAVAAGMGGLGLILLGIGLSMARTALRPRS